MKKTIIKIQYKWSYLQFIMLASMMLLLTVLPLFIFNTPNDQNIYKIIWLTVFPIFAIVFIVFSLIYYQIAQITEESIIICSKLFKIKEIKWTELKKIQIEKLASGTAGVSIIYKEWIVLYTDEKQYRNHGGVNKAKKGPWYIAFSNKNAEIIKQYVEKYGSNTCIRF